MIAFDVGGTTAKCALIEHGRFDVRSTYYIGGYEKGFPVRAPILDIVEVGAGGGSIAWVDAQQRLRLGPRSAGSEPGPACYGRGGTEPTLTDANLVLGRIDPAGFAQAGLALAPDAAMQALQEKIVDKLSSVHIPDAAAAALGILAIATTTMAHAIHRITIERGHDTREFTLFAYGGGGPLHAVDVARELHIRRVLIPPSAGMFSAVGMLWAQSNRDRSRTVRMPLDQAAFKQIDHLFDELAREMDEDEDEEAATLDIATVNHRYLDLKYRGQAQPLQLLVEDKDAELVREAFESAYAAQFGFVRIDYDIEIVGLRLVANRDTGGPELHPKSAAKASSIAPMNRNVTLSSGQIVKCRVFQRADLNAGFEIEGPAIVEEYGTSTIVGIGDRLVVGALGELQITLAEMSS